MIINYPLMIKLVEHASSRIQIMVVLEAGESNSMHIKNYSPMMSKSIFYCTASNPHNILLLLYFTETSNPHSHSIQTVVANFYFTANSNPHNMQNSSC